MREQESEQALLTDVPLFNPGALVCRRLFDGRVACNLPQAHKHHSPTGFEISYGGSGPADLALNVLASIVPAGSDGLRPVECLDGTKVSATAMILHQEFKAAFIARMRRDGDTIPLSTIREWVETKRKSPAFAGHVVLYQPISDEV